MTADRNALIRKMLILLGLTSCLLIATPSVARADCWDDCFACHDDCDYQEWVCDIGCTAYTGEAYDQCIDSCGTVYNNCTAACNEQCIRCY